MISERKALTRIFGLAAVALFIVGAWPMSYLASPRWDVRIVTDVGQPVPQINVRLVYQDYSVESESHEVTLRTDEDGHVLFPQHYQSACIFQRVFHTVSSAGTGVHSSFGRHAYVLAFGGREGFDSVDWRGSPKSMQSSIVVK
jgi:hypothetical protein